ncbi:MAG: nucleoside-diphosphate kinase [Nanoarchaeota archaeon]|nr:nucleoside-diphosphate kinase [Nanoarchaeota archaeon]
MIQKTLVLIKPDGVQRGLIGEIIKRLEQRGLKIIAMKMVQADRILAEKHYTESITEKHGEKARISLIDYIMYGPVIAMVVQGSSAITLVRKIVGATFPGDADIGTIRGDFTHMSKARTRQINKGYNLVHASENEEDSKKEIGLWFSDKEIHDYKLSAEDYLLG